MEKPVNSVQVKKDFVQLTDTQKYELNEAIKKDISRKAASMK